MLLKLTAKFIFVLLMSTSVRAQDVPDYITYMERSKFTASLLSSGKSCQHLGFDVDEAGISRYAKRFVVSGVEAGIAVDTANTLFISAMKDDREALDLIQKTFETDAKSSDKSVSQPAIERYFEFWFKRCRSLSESEVGSNYYTFNREKFDKQFPDK